MSGGLMELVGTNELNRFYPKRESHMILPSCLFTDFEEKIQTESEVVADQVNSIYLQITLPKLKGTTFRLEKGFYQKILQSCEVIHSQPNIHPQDRYVFHILGTELTDDDFIVEDGMMAIILPLQKKIGRYNCIGQNDGNGVYTRPVTKINLEFNPIEDFIQIENREFHNTTVLPNEIWHKIMNYCDTETWYTLQKVSNLFRMLPTRKEIFERIEYENSKVSVHVEWIYLDIDDRRELAESGCLIEK